MAGKASLILTSDDAFAKYSLLPSFCLFRDRKRKCRERKRRKKRKKGRGVLEAFGRISLCAFVNLISITESLVEEKRLPIAFPCLWMHSK